MPASMLGIEATEGEVSCIKAYRGDCFVRVDGGVFPAVNTLNHVS